MFMKGELKREETNSNCVTSLLKIEGKNNMRSSQDSNLGFFNFSQMLLPTEPPGAIAFKQRISDMCSQEFITLRVCNSHMVSIPAIWIGQHRQSAGNIRCENSAVKRRAFVTVFT